MAQVSRIWISAGSALLLCSILGATQPQPTSASTGPIGHAVSAQSAVTADNGNWEMPGKTYASTRFSALNEITPANANRLGAVFTFSTATTHGYEAPPLVVDGTMYLITPYPNYLYALD